jgi:hypothetical protein
MNNTGDASNGESLAKINKKPKRKGHVGESRSSRRRLQIIQKENSALEMRMAGFSFPEISAALSYKGRSGSFRAVESALKRREPASVAMAREMNLERMNHARRAYWGSIEPGDPEKYLAINSEIKVSQIENNLLGLDAPKQQVNRNLNYNVEISYEKPVIGETPVGETPLPELPIIEHSNEG